MDDFEERVRAVLVAEMSGFEASEELDRRVRAIVATTPRSRRRRRRRRPARRAVVSSTGRFVRITLAAALFAVLGVARFGPTFGVGVEPAGAMRPITRWDISKPSPLRARAGMSLVWTGREAIVWGGVGPGLNHGSAKGAAYDPVTDSWRSIADAPAGRVGHIARWTGREMIVWGGDVTPAPGRLDAATSPGAVYNPRTDTWRLLPMSPLPAPPNPEVRQLLVTVWTGGELFVWGEAQQGAAYDPATDSWRTLPALPGDLDKPPMLLSTPEGVVLLGPRRYVDPVDGRLIETAVEVDVLDSRTEIWRRLPRSDVPPPNGFGAVWTGDELVVIGGPDQTGADAPSRTSGRYSPEEGTWRRVADPPVTTAIANRLLLWTGSELVLLGLEDVDGTVWVRAFAWDPATDRWRTLPSPPPTRYSLLIAPGHFVLPSVRADDRILLWTGEVFARWH